MRDIVVHSPGHRTWNGSVRYAAQLAASMHAALTGLFVAPCQAPVIGPAKLVAEVAAYAQDDLHQAMLAGRDFQAWANQLGVRRTFWQVAIGQHPDDALARIGDWHDLVVLRSNPLPGLSAEHVIGGVLSSGAACIVVPEANVAHGCVHVMVAWDGSAASSRVLHAALPLLRTAQTVSLLQPKTERGGGRRSDAYEHLRLHGIRISAVETVATGDAAVSDHVLAYADDTRADLVVMGTSGAQRPGGRCLGPVTNGLLTRGRLPVFLKS